MRSRWLASARSTTRTRSRRAGRRRAREGRDSERVAPQLLTLPAPIQLAPSRQNRRHVRAAPTALFGSGSARRSTARGAGRAAPFVHLDARRRRRRWSPAPGAVGSSAWPVRVQGPRRRRPARGGRRRGRRGHPDLGERRLRAIDRLDRQNRQRAARAPRPRAAASGRPSGPRSRRSPRSRRRRRRRRSRTATRASALRNARSTVPRRSPLFPTTSLSTSNRAAPQLAAHARQHLGGDRAPRPRAPPAPRAAPTRPRAVAASASDASSAAERLRRDGPARRRRGAAPQGHCFSMSLAASAYEPDGNRCRYSSASIPAAEEPRRLSISIFRPSACAAYVPAASSRR